MWLSIKPIISNFAALNNGLVPLNGPSWNKRLFMDFSMLFTPLCQFLRWYSFYVKKNDTKVRLVTMKYSNTSLFCVARQYVCIIVVSIDAFCRWILLVKLLCREFLFTVLVKRIALHKMSYFYFSIF
jgi:hypothetical protein